MHSRVVGLESAHRRLMHGFVGLNDDQQLAV
jgi:hypothetical protein